MSTSSSDRRDFLKSAAAAAGVATMAGLSGAYAAGNDTIKVGVIGVGGRGRGAVKNILQADAAMNGASPRVEIVAVGDVFKGQADSAVRAFKNSSNNADSEFAPFVKQIKA